MKKILVLGLMVFTIISYSQKKKNGTIYIDHPAINTVDAYTKAVVEGDAEKAGAFLADDYKYWNGTNSNKDAKGGTKEGAIKNVTWWKENIDYFSIERSSGTYPDAIEYKDQEQEDVVWVQTWDHVKGVHKKTGVKIDMPIHRLFTVNKDNKITMIIDYSDRTVWQELRQSWVTRENGTVYNHHDYINTVRKLMAALEHHDMDKFYSFFDEEATFRSIHMPIGTKSSTLEEDKEGMKNMMGNFDITSIDVQGYPDYINYEIRNAKVVQSWWKIRMTRRSDNKKIVMPLFVIHDFNDEGKITGELVYFSQTLMQK
jgi:ketosteroid isomerase-like protein